MAFVSQLHEDGAVRRLIIRSSIGEVRAQVGRVADDLPLTAAASVADEIDNRRLAISEWLRGTNRPDAEQAVAQLAEAVAKVRDAANALDGVGAMCRAYAARI